MKVVSIPVTMSGHAEIVSMSVNFLCRIDK